LFIVAILVAVLGPIAVAGMNSLLDARFQADSAIQYQPALAAGSSELQECIPAIDKATFTDLDSLVVSKSDDPVISLKMSALFAADQAVRRIPSLGNFINIDEEDRQHRIQVLGLIQQGQIHSPRNLVYSAYIFQHGDCPAHYLFGNRLAKIAMQVDYQDAKWIYAASMDRYLVHTGENQKYGTQYTWINGEFQLYPVDPTTTDAERAEYNVPSLQESLNQSPRGTGSGAVQRRWLETWWLTLIGTAFAGLGAIIGIVDPKKNPRHGQVVLGISIVVYLVSIFGHLSQVTALRQGDIEMQGNIWSLVNGLMILLWMAFIIFEVYCVKNKHQ
jgi:uncharacterized membrane protein YhaH (DUF805 family)